MQKYSLLLLLDVRVSTVARAGLLLSAAIALIVCQTILSFFFTPPQVCWFIGVCVCVCCISVVIIAVFIYFAFLFVLYLAVVALIFYESLLHNLINLHLVSFNYFSSFLSLLFQSNCTAMNAWVSTISKSFACLARAVSIEHNGIKVKYLMNFSFCICCSIRTRIPGTQIDQTRCRQIVCHEGAQ